VERNDLLLVFSNPVAGRDDEYNTWYDEVHLGDVQRIPGVTGATRYELDPAGAAEGSAPAHRYLAVYELGGDGADVLAELMKRAGGPELQLSESLDLSTIGMAVWKRRG
jgi:hypothetical protein